MSIDFEPQLVTTMSELTEIKMDISETKAKIKKAEDERRSEAYLTSLQGTLAEQQKKENLLLARQQGEQTPARTG